MRFRFVLLLLALPVMASAERQHIDTIQAITADMIGATAIWADPVGDRGIDSALTSRILRRVSWCTSDTKDTTLWYIKAIGEKCDSTYKKIYIPEAPPISNQYATVYREVYERTITCKADTTWAEKIQVWLRPEQLEKLNKLLNN